MNEFNKPAKVSDAEKVDINLPLPPERESLSANAGQTQVEVFMARRSEVAKSDHEAFQDYLR